MIGLKFSFTVHILVKVNFTWMKVWPRVGVEEGWRGFQILLLSWVDYGSGRLPDSVQFHLANQKQDWSGSVELQF